MTFIFIKGFTFTANQFGDGGGVVIMLVMMMMLVMLLVVAYIFSSEIISSYLVYGV